MSNDKFRYNLLKTQSNLKHQNVFLDSYPSQIHFLMIDKCNANCIMCGGDYFKSKSGRVITLDKFKKMAVNLKFELVGGIVLAGAGDPLLNRDLVLIIQFVRANYPHINISVTTNGLALTEDVSGKMINSDTNLVNISINSATRGTYKRIMQLDGFEAVCRNARNFVEMRNRSKKPVALQFSAAINRLNIEELPRLVELGREIGANGINLFYTRYYPEQIRHANVDDPADRLEDSTSLFYHQELSDSMVLEAKDLAQKFGIGLTHEPLFRDHAGAPPCTWAMTQLMVGFDGEVYPCGGSEVHFREKVEGGVYDFGNALHDHIDTFWNNELYRALRHSSRQVGECLVSECGCCANVVSPNDIKSHIMHWDQHDSINGRKEPCGLPRDDRKMATSSSPLVSVIVPTYNRPDQLVGALRSILGQSYKEVEIIVVNDCGADVESILSFLNKKNQITYIRHGKNRGLAAARNTGIKIARGKYIAYLDDDDIYYPNHIETLVRFLETSDHKVAYTDAHRAHQFQQNGVYVVTKRDVPYSFDFDYDRILQTNFLPVLCLMHERECLEVVDFFDEDLKRLEDWDLWIRLSRTLKFAHIKKVTCEFSWRIDGSTMTSAQDQEFDHARKYISQKYGRMHSANSSQLKIEGPSVKKMVSIIILTYNQLEFTKECVNSIQKHTKEPYEIIFVDNSSTDGTRKWLGKIVNDNPNYKLIENPKNLGFAKGCNQGMKASSGEYIVLLNNDVIVTGNWLSGLLEGLAEHPEVGIVGPMTNNISGPQKIPDVGYDSLDGIEKYAHSFREKNRNRRIRWRRIVGFCMLFRHELVNEIGGLDESFGSGNFEDDDYCLRVELAGYKNFIVGDVFIHHFGSVTFVGNKIDYGTSITGNRKIFDQKWGGIDINSPLGGQVLVLNAFEKADELSQKGLVEKAIEILSGIIAHVPEEKRAYYILTEIFLNTKQYDKALDVLDKMLEHLKDLRHKELLAYSMMGLDRVKDAELCADAILNSDPLSAPALIVKGIVASKQGDTESAELYLNKAISVNPSSGYSYTNMGLLRQEQGKKQEALPLLEKGAILSPLFLDAVSDYLEAALEAGAFEKVEHFLKEAVSLHPNNKRLKYAYIDILLKQKKNGKAQQQKEEAKAWFGPEIDIGSWTMQPGEENLNCEREKVQLASFDINITVSLIIRVISEFDVLQKCIKSFEKYTEVPFELILIVDSLSKKNKERLNKISANIVNLKLIKIKKGTSSGHCYNEGLKESKGEFFVFCHSDIIFSCGWYDSFSKSISNAANVGIVGPLLNDVEGLQRYKNASGVSIDQFDEIAQKIQEHYRHRRISINKLSSYCFMCRRALFKNVGCFDEKFVMEDFLMEDFCRRISIAGRENFIVADVLLYHFDNHKKKLKGEKKTQAFKADKMAYVEKWGAVKLDTPLGSRLLLLKSLDKAKTLEQQEDVEKAASQLLKTIAHAPKDKAAYLALAELFFQAKQYDEALGVLGKFPDVKDPKYTELIGYCMEGKGNIEEAEKYAEKALSINSKSPQALNLKGVCLYKNGKKGESEEYIKKAIESDPGYGEPYTNQTNRL
jgi:GT2 family glycosyltransferase/MoaA/NifB/PqqE/SkfB family radical SAM enzyme